MSKVITFSRYFPAGHARAKQPTYFVEQLLSAVYRKPDGTFDESRFLKEIDPDMPISLGHTMRTLIDTLINFQQKVHTIRGGHRWKSGEKFSPRFWSGSGKPYNSKMITICPDITIADQFDFKIDGMLKDGQPIIETRTPIIIKDRKQPMVDCIAQNDGLTTLDFINWFAPHFPFDGQIITFKPGIYEMV